MTPLEARATVNLPGLRAGGVVTVDADDPYIRGLLDATWLVPAGAGPGAVQDFGRQGTPPGEAPMQDPKFGDHVLFDGEAGENQFGHIVDVRSSGNVDILYKQDGGGMEIAEDVPYRGAADRKTDGGGHTYHHHGD